ncbi:protein kinase domain-containing protein [Sandaracinus amylolyticus]|uniref:Serine/threonine protein kinase n=1 Tax=Sandaracinus amylolyticus TaxID=927083 RepID=A0A0F6YGZ9_9BACT|nr:protein kinase [Sandaracinus amylolyticus]AKF05266.1 serine/threonine protein kinase [Sandaracinus amylolyticus]
MRASREHLDGLARLHRIADAEERRAVFRQSIATLAAAASDLRPVPLEGLDPIALRDGTRMALASGLFEDLGWLKPAAAAGALYELGAALPAGDEKRELGRRVLRALHEGNAATFTLLATLLATGSRRGLSGSAIRARVALALDMPIGSGIRADPLALALIARRDLAEDWLITPSTGSLPSRRLAARLLERAAREAARRAKAGDAGALAIFDRPSVQSATQRLLSDREPLVWRHVATARGLLAQAIPRFGVEIDDSLHASLTPTEWRRAAASLASTMAIDAERARRRCADLLQSDLARRDPGLASAMILGLARAAEAEPDAAEELLNQLVRAGGLDAIEALIEIRAERVGGELGEWAARLALARLREDAIARDEGDDGRAALLRAIDFELRSRDERDGSLPTLRDQLDDAKAAFVEADARTAYGKAFGVLRNVEGILRLLEESRDEDRDARIESFLRLRELDSALLESSSLADLLQLGDKGAGAAHRVLDNVFERLTTYLGSRESEPVRGEVEHITLRLRRMRTLLHVVDADGGHLDERTAELRDRRLRTGRLLVKRAREDEPSPLRRIVGASLARACDAILREELGELSDVLIAAASHLHSEHDLGIVAEATMVPEAADAFRAYASLIERTERSARVTEARALTSLDGLKALIRHLPGAGSPRVEALRVALLAYAEAIESISDAGSLAELAGLLEGTSSAIAALGEASSALARLVVGARRRLGESMSGDVPNVGAALRAVDVAVLQAARAGQDASAVGDAEEPFDLGSLADAIAAGIDTLRVDLPLHLAEVAANVLARIVTLPAYAQRRSRPPRATSRAREAALPPWLPPSRTIGGFYVLRALGSGAVGSVFVARRAEERSNETAPRFALKVPEYAGSAARTLSEGEFLQLFREEAGALLAVPPHPNLAKLVTFDAGARPKPILVMELVEGPTLERIIETGALDMERALRVMWGIASGLGAMHEVGVGHLDLKPSNVILRDPDGPGPELETSVLVDFGLAGRKLRPGCATASYGAPEVWGLMPKGHSPRPMPADVYALGCVMYEILTGQTLFTGPTDLSIVTAHLQHDGDLRALDALVELEHDLLPLVDAIRHALRQDPRQRATIDDICRAIETCAPMLSRMRWPLPAPAILAA